MASTLFACDYRFVTAASRDRMCRLEALAHGMEASGGAACKRHAVIQASCPRHETIIFVRQHDRVEIDSEPRMHQAIPRPAPRLAHPDTPDLGRYGLFIRLGCVQPSERLELALQALAKTLRYWEGTVRLLIAAEHGHAWQPGLLLPHCGFHAPEELRCALQRGDTTVLAPGFNDPRGDITLHALASGVPLGAINLAPLPMEASSPPLPEGSAFLAVDHRASQRPH